MTIVAPAGGSFTARLVGADDGLADSLTAKIARNGVDVSAPTGVIVEAANGDYVAPFTAPTDPGSDYVVLWTLGTPPEAGSEQLEVTGSYGFTPPTVEQVAALEHERTGSDGGFAGTFLLADADPTTNPTREQVIELIDLACWDVNDRFRVLPTDRDDRLRRAAAYYAASLVETSFFPDEDTPAGRRYLAQYLSAIAALGGYAGDGNGTTGEDRVPATFQNVVVRSPAALPLYPPTPDVI